MTETENGFNDNAADFYKDLFEGIKISNKAEFIFDGDRTGCNIVGSYKVDTPHLDKFRELIVPPEADNFWYDAELFVSIHDDETCTVDVQLWNEAGHDKGLYSSMYLSSIPVSVEYKMEELLMQAVGADDMHELVSMTAAMRPIDYSQAIVSGIPEKMTLKHFEYTINLPDDDLIYMLETTGIQTAENPVSQIISNAENVDVKALYAKGGVVSVEIQIDGKRFPVQISPDESDMLKKVLDSYSDKSQDKSSPSTEL